MRYAGDLPVNSAKTEVTGNIIYIEMVLLPVEMNNSEFTGNGLIYIKTLAVQISFGRAVIRTDK